MGGKDENSQIGAKENKAEDQELKPLLATLEYKARKCKECIERRLAVRN